MTQSSLSPLARTAGQRPDHFHAIDLLRGLTAIAVLIHHYQHFFLSPGIFKLEAEAILHRFPFHEVLGPLYLRGDVAVQVFWMISGFVFAHAYAGTTVGAGDFAVRRLARLYPLHFATLVIVAALQLVAADWHGTPLIYPHADAWHFVLNLAFVPAWGLEQGPSFNGPVWSVSVELLIYAVFWVFARRLFRYGAAGPLLLAVFAGALYVQALDSFRI